MQYFKLQLACMLLVLYVTFIYIRERHVYNIKEKEPIFNALLVTGIIGIFFDGATAYMVNNLDIIPESINMFCHMMFLCSIDVIIFLMFLYVADICGTLERLGRHRKLLAIPLAVNIAVVVIFMPQLEYRHGDVTNYSMGISAYTCFVMVGVYMTATLIVLFSNIRNLGRNKLVTISTYLAACILVTLYQMKYPQALLTSIVLTFVIIGSYLNMENPVLTKLRTYNQEMVMGFATLVENRDGSTGGHIKRSTQYVEILAQELNKRNMYRDILTKDYIRNLIMAAPMHDVGKIAIPDAILQKPGRLTDEEYDIMKTHAERGGNIIKETFGHMGDAEYEKMAYEVARYHHEKWNGRGYPDGLSGEDIPLCARIMAVADVFDAVSARRCYRDAMPLEECYKIIRNGSGQDFDPEIAAVFLDMKDEIHKIIESSQS